MRALHLLVGALILASLSACTPTLEAACTSDADCGAGRCVEGLCLAPTPVTPSCTNKLKDGDETGLDCGGSVCGRCAVDAACNRPSDCASGLCTAGKCTALATCANGGRDPGEDGIDCGAACSQPCPPVACASDVECTNTRCDTASGTCAGPACSDGLKNGGETDIDCGGSCEKCSDGKGCNGAGECRSSVCRNGTCVAPACDDRIQNGDESDEDCGGSCSAKCADTKTCGGGLDCRSGYCANGVCTPAACGDGAQNGDETDQDCGGSCATKCADTQRCLQDTDCLSRHCDAFGTKTCLAPSCTDGRLNGHETAMDCGGTGTGCPRCDTSLDCLVGDDCASGVCDALKKCGAPSCDPRDFIANGLETDIDCGGADPRCPRCELDKRCAQDTDCATAHCSGNLCVAPRCNNTTNPCTDPLQVCDAVSGRCLYQPCPTGRDDSCALTGYCNRLTSACEPNPCSRPGCGAPAASCTTAGDCCSGRCDGPFTDVTISESTEPGQSPDDPNPAPCPAGGIRLTITVGADTLPPRFACDDGDSATPAPSVDISRIIADTTCVGGGQRLRITDNIQGVVTTDESFCHRGTCGDRAPTGIQHFSGRQAEMMVGCPGNYGYGARASACGRGFHVCSAAEWTTRRGGDGSLYNAWVEEPLSMAIFTNESPRPLTGRPVCSAIGSGALTSGTIVSCAADRPARVCTVPPTGSTTSTDDLGNSCGPYTDCGLADDLTSQFFGGCDGSSTASVLCCRN